jgi:Reverse transcriptase (RNA-dependent DNA polymerase).
VQNAKLVLYADDTNILVVDKDMKVFELKTALVMTQLKAWLFDNELVLNTAKTCALLFHSSQQKCVDKPHIMYDNKFIAYSPTIKFLGITLTVNLKWHACLDILCKSLTKAYFMIKYLKQVISHHSVRILYHAYFQSRMKYDIIFWLMDSYSKNVFCFKRR